MKKFYSLLAVLLVATTAQAQEKSLDRLWNPYITASYSIGNTTSTQYKDNTYFALEGGVTRGNLGLFGAVGRGTTKGAFGADDNIHPYWVEVGTTVSQSVGMVDVYGVIGVGSYIQADKAFIEYGFGMSMPVAPHLTVGGKVTNWDNAWYVSPTITYSF